MSLPRWLRMIAAGLMLSLPSFTHGQSVLHHPLGTALFRPNAIGTAPDGTFYVADEASQTIRRFQADGLLIGEFDSPVKGTSYDITGLAVDSAGSLHASWALIGSNGVVLGNSTSGVASLAPSGALLANENLGPLGLSGISVDADDRVYVLGTTTLGRVTGGVLETLAQSSGPPSNRRLQIGPDNRLYVQSNRTFTPTIDVYETSGALAGSFSVDNPLMQETLTGFAVTADGLFATDNLSGTIRQFTTSGELVGVGYGVPRVSDLAASASGAILAAMPQNRVVESIDADRYSPDYAGVTLLTESRRDLTSAPYGLWNNLDLSDGWQESSAATFLVPGAAGEMVDIDFRYVASSQSVMTVFPVASVTADPASDPMEYMRQAMANSLTSLNLSRPHPCAVRPDAPGCENIDGTLLETVTVEAGTEIGFVHLRNRWSFPPAGSGVWASHLGPELLARSKMQADDTFAALSELSDADFAEVMTRYLDDPISRLDSLLPLASDSRANWGRLDQFSFFLGDGATLLVMEDLSQAGLSDLSYHDATLLIDLRLIPTPEPSTALLALLMMQTVTTARLRAR